MFVELDEIQTFQAVEGVEQGHLRFGLVGLGRLAELFDEDSRNDLLLDVDGRCVDLEVGLVERLLALPDEHWGPNVSRVGD